MQILKKQGQILLYHVQACPDGLGRAGIIVDDIEVLDCSAPKFDSKWADPSFVRVSDRSNNKAYYPFGYWTRECIITGERIYSTEAFFAAVDFLLSHPISESLSHYNEIVVGLALLDRRVGKRTLQNISANMKDASELALLFYELRCKAEYA